MSDTAGLRLTDDVVESEGVRRALTRAESSDLVILLLDGTKALECAQELGLEELSVPDRAGRHMRDLGLKPTNAQKVNVCSGQVLYGKVEFWQPLLQHLLLKLVG